MSKKLKPINQSELQVGKLYCDTSRFPGFNTVIMRYLGRIKGNHEFMYVSGYSEYLNEEDGIIRFGHYAKEPNWFWELPKENADVIENKISASKI